MKNTLKLFIPPIFFKLKAVFSKKEASEDIQFRKTDLSWDEIVKTTEGYSAENILEKCCDALLKVKNGEYPYERDSVLFEEKEIFYPLLAALFYAAAQNQNKLDLIDFGGSLGSTYYQNKDILKQAGLSLNWNIVEQANFVKCGRENFENSELRFFYKAEDVFNCVVLHPRPVVRERCHVSNEKSSRILLLSSVLPYLKKPYDMLNKLFELDFQYVIIDRTWFLETEPEDVLTIQTVPAWIYKAAYPAWFLAKVKFREYIKNKYNVIFSWTALDQHRLPGFETGGYGFLLKRIN
jgi:putative methyltransferase (TIGR04325 family)